MAIKMLNEKYQKYTPIDLIEGQLLCEQCTKYEDCYSSSNCAANCIYEDKVYHYRDFDIDANKKIETPNDLIGKRISSVSGGKPGDDTFMIEFSDGFSLELYHEQNCCEHVSIDDVNGNIDDMIGDVLLRCECASNVNFSARNKYDESYTWTFYRFATQRAGYIDMKWYGTSNGYYSEGVNWKIRYNGNVIADDFGHTW